MSLKHEKLDSLVRERILILDGAMGSMLQSYELSDTLCLSKPDLISSIHEAYLEAGADIITSCSFNANAVSLANYGLAEKAYDISLAAGTLARRAADKYSTPEKTRFAAGSMGPTAKSASISPDMNDPGKRGVSWDELEAAYYDNARGLLDGGVDILLLETVFDTLNAKAAIASVLRLREERGVPIPLMISATISDAAGRLLSGQTVEAFAVSVAHGEPFSLGLNCSLGAEKILPHLSALSAFTPYPVSCHPNAGLPDRFGEYTEGPEETALFMKSFFEQGLVNIAGGCCGTTPAHIAAIAELAKNYAPRPLPEKPARSYLAGLDALPLPEKSSGSENFIDIGERTNVAGSRKFLRLIQNNAWEEAAGLAREMIASGARIVDVCMDDALLDGKAAMVRFLNIALSDPEIARFPVMPDSSRWETLEAALKCIQGKGLVNSISLKEGESEFLRRAALIRRYGAAAVVMLFDEAGQAQDYERKTEIAARSYRLLTTTGFPPEDIVFDPNVLTIATGMAEHDRYALDFIRACAWIKEHCPGVHISAGLSNLSFSFRGSEEIRAALHAVFLKHAINAGLSMAILNPSALVSYDEIPATLRDAAEDAVLCRNVNDSTERLLALGKKEAAAVKGVSSKKEDDWRSLPVDKRIDRALVNGIDQYIAADVLELYGNGKTYLEIVEGPLMRGMEETGRRFGEGRMFLPQVIRSARVMQKAVTALEPYIAADKNSRSAGKIVLATVKGDVHDIGKNIVAVILGCNGYEVIDLGVMAPADRIIETARNTGADCIGLSGLISPSLDEMVRTAEALEKSGLAIPLLIGGAAASSAHSALRIAPVYSGPVVYVRNAGEVPQVVRALLSPQHRTAFLEKLASEYIAARKNHEKIGEKRRFLTLEEARARRLAVDWSAAIPVPKIKGIVQYNQYPVDKVAALIDWDSFCRAWDLREKSGGAQSREYSKAREELICDALALLERTKENFSLRAVIGFFPAVSENEDIVVYACDDNLNGQPQELARFCFLRNQEAKASNLPNLCLSDFILPENPQEKPAPHDWLGLFALTAEFKTETADNKDKYNALLISTLANSLAEAFSEELHHKIQSESWPVSIRPAFGYPACPDHNDKRTAFALLEAHERIGLTLSESAMIIPASSVCGMYFACPQARYFGAGQIAADQLTRWAQRKGISVAEAQRRTGLIH